MLTWRPLHRTSVPACSTSQCRDRPRTDGTNQRTAPRHERPPSRTRTSDRSVVGKGGYSTPGTHKATVTPPPTYRHLEVGLVVGLLLHLHVVVDDVGGLTGVREAGRVMGEGHAAGITRLTR